MRASRLRRRCAAFNRLRRRLGFDRNQLRRRVDRLQWVAGLTLLLLYLVTAPAVTAVAVERVYANGIRAEHAQTREATGRTAERPRTHTDTVADSATAGVIAVAVSGLPFLSVYLIVRRRSDRHRQRSWDTAWAGLDRRHAA
ncbi:hypothetical protein ACGFNU_44430 [Spirillospora sp. NPDC048911]|uniref:hypothetical protein n=1 Tax=Spirillospora sp. NPDC048911 TaxID=3364527 RepID=UPI003711D28B